MRGEAGKAILPAGHQLLADFLGHLANERRLSRNTILSYERDVAALLELAAATPLAKLQIHHLRRFIAQLHARGLDGRSLARMLSASFFGGTLAAFSERRSRSLRSAPGSSRIRSDSHASSLARSAVSRFSFWSA